MHNLHKHTSTRKTPQNQKIPGSDQVPNWGGGYSFEVDQWTRLERFLIIGTEGGSYYASERELTLDNAENLLECIAEDGERTVDIIAQISDEGRAVRNDTCLFALAVASAEGDEATRRAAYQALPDVARIGTHLFQFAEYRKAFAGWGQGYKNAVARWYTNKKPRYLAYQLLKYRSRYGWSHRDMLRISHPNPEEGSIYDQLFGFVTQDEVPARWAENEAGEYVEAFLKAQDLSEGDEDEAVRLIDEYRLTREMLPTELLGSREVWEALFRDMPIHALIRNLANLTRREVLKPLGDNVQEAVDTLTDQEHLQRARVHPIQVLNALKTYRDGSASSRGYGYTYRSSGPDYTPIEDIVDALDEAFYLAFDVVEPANKKFLLGLDVSGSMSTTIPYFSNLTAAEATAAMALVTKRTEPVTHAVAFSRQLKNFPISDRERLDDVMKRAEAISFGATNCALPMTYATENNLDVEVFVVYTDHETNYGRIHPVQALQEYRQKSGNPAKLIVVGTQGNPFSIADPDDGGSLDLIGFDSSAPQIISEFAGM